MQTNDWESRCNQCGKCCLNKHYGDNNEIVYDGTGCQHLDMETMKCTVYKNRFSIKPTCIKLTEENVKKFDWLPPDCAYKKD